MKTEEYGKIYVDDDQCLIVDLGPQFHVWEHIDEHSVHFDNVGTGATVELKDIPVVIEFLQQVLKRAPTRRLRTFNERNELELDA